MRTVAELTLGREADAVPRARRLVRSALAGERPDVAGDAELVVSELVTNAVLHGEAPIVVRVLVNHSVRLEIRDTGRSVPLVVHQGSDAMTGRGLSMVAALAASWGVDPLDGGGKTVWAELDTDAAATTFASSPEIDVDALLEAWADDDPATATYTVRLGPVATELLLAAKAHMDNVVRELVLIREGEASSGVALPPELSSLIQTVTVDFAEARTEIKRQAVAAVTRGDLLTELELHVSLSAADLGERYLEALDEADRYARAAHFLTLAPPRVHRVFRRWYVRSLVDQLRARAAGRVPADPAPFQLVLLREIEELSESAESAARLALVHKLSTELAAVHTAEEMALIAVDHVIAVLAVETVRVRLPVEGSLRSVAWRGRPGRRDRGLVDIPLDSELPGALAVRTRQPVHVRALDQAFGRMAELAGSYEPGLNAHTVPLVAGDDVLGLLSLSFCGGEMSDQSEMSFVTSLSDVLALALKRAQLERRLAAD